MLAYPIIFTPDEGSTMITCPDFPELVTCANPGEDALAIALDALEEVIAGRIKDREDIPPPSASSAGLVVLPALTAAKVAIYQELRRQKVSKAELARRLGWAAPQADRLVDIRHASRLDQLETALAALGKRLVVEVRDAA